MSQAGAAVAAASLPLPAPQQQQQREPHAKSSSKRSKRKERGEGGEPDPASGSKSSRKSKKSRGGAGEQRPREPSRLEWFLNALPRLTQWDTAAKVHVCNELGVPVPEGLLPRCNVPPVESFKSTADIAAWLEARYGHYRARFYDQAALGRALAEAQLEDPPAGEAASDAAGSHAAAAAAAAAAGTPATPAELPAGAAAGGQRMLRVKIEVPKDRNKKRHEQLGPVLLSAPTLAPPDIGQPPPLQSVQVVPAAGGKQGPLLVIGRKAEAPGALLLGTTEPDDEPTVAHGTIALGVYDKASHTLQLMRAAGNKVVRLEALPALGEPFGVAGLTPPEIAARQEAQRAARLARSDQDQAQRRAETRKLVEQFGSTRRKRQLREREEAAVRVDANADQGGLALTMREVQAKAAATGDTRAEVLARVGGARVIPAHNPAATKPGDAYRLADMFAAPLLSALNAGQMLHASEKEEDKQKLQAKGLMPAYVLSRLPRIAAAKDGRERKAKARQLALLAALLQLAGARSRLPLKPPRPAAEEGGRDRPGGLQELTWQLKIGRQEVAEQLLGQFYLLTHEAGSAVYVREDSKQQLLLMHALVVALMVEDWQMAAGQFDALRRELKMSASDVVSRFRELGCTCLATKLAQSAAEVTAAALAGGGPSPEAGVTAYNVTLLGGPEGGAKALADVLPKARLAKGQPKAGR